jgi:flagellar protein FlbD
VIVLHRLTHPNEPFHLNPDSIHMVEAHPDTVIVLTNGSKLVVGETPEEVANAVREWRASILRSAAGGAPVYEIQALAAR